MAVGPYDTPAFYMEHKKQQAVAMENAKQVILDVAAEFEKLSGRKYGLFETYKLDDAEMALVIINSAAGTAKDAVDRLRAEGKKVGLLKIRVFRPFPAEEIAEALKNVKVIAVMDRCEGFSSQGGPLGAEVKSALFTAGSTAKVVDYVYGIGGRDVRVENIEEVYAALEEILTTGNVGETYRYLSLRD